jgi:hypothetical protein
MSASNTARPSFSEVLEGVYVFELRVYDGHDTSSPSSVTVTVQSAAREVTQITPEDGTVCYSSPTLKWTGVGFKGYKAYISIDGKRFSKVYSGTSTSTTLHSVLWRWFIPAGTTVTWYVEGTATDGQIVKSANKRFIRK